MTYQEIQAEHSRRMTVLFDTHGVFFAFGNDQFREATAKNDPAEKYVSLGAGGYMPKRNLEAFNVGWKELRNWHKQAVKTTKAEDTIRYELGNHEAWYTGDIEDAMRVLGPLGYTREQVWKVFHDHYDTERG